MSSTSIAANFGEGMARCYQIAIGEGDHKCGIRLTPIPNAFSQCSISSAPMKTPVILTDGSVYDRGSINKWFWIRERTSQIITSPLTGLQLQSKLALPVDYLKTLIENFLSHRPETGALCSLRSGDAEGALQLLQGLQAAEVDAQVDPPDTKAGGDLLDIEGVDQLDAAPAGCQDEDELVELRALRDMLAAELADARRSVDDQNARVILWEGRAKQLEAENKRLIADIRSVSSSGLEPGLVPSRQSNRKRVDCETHIAAASRSSTSKGHPDRPACDPDPQCCCRQEVRTLKDDNKRLVSRLNTQRRAGKHAVGKLAAARSQLKSLQSELQRRRATTCTCSQADSSAKGADDEMKAMLQMALNLKDAEMESAKAAASGVAVAQHHSFCGPSLPSCPWTPEWQAASNSSSAAPCGLASGQAAVPWMPMWPAAVACTPLQCGKTEAPLKRARRDS